MSHPPVHGQGARRTDLDVVRVRPDGQHALPGGLAGRPAHILSAPPVRLGEKDPRDDRGRGLRGDDNVVTPWERTRAV